MQDDPPQDERKQRAKQLRDQWRKEKKGTIFDLKPFSKRERIYFCIEIVFWLSLALFSLIGAFINVTLFLLNNYEYSFNGRWPFLVISFCCLLFAVWAARFPWRRAKARQNAVKRGDDPPQDEFDGVLDDAPTTPDNMYGDES